MRLQYLFTDWSSVSVNPNDKFFTVSAQDLLQNVDQLKEIFSESVFMSKMTIYGFEDKNWNYWNSSSSGRPDECEYTRNSRTNAKRFYGGLSARLRSLAGKLTSTVNGQEKECDVVGLVTKKNSVAHNTVQGKENQTDNLNYFRMFYDIAFIWSPPIGVEIKNWTAIEDWTADGNNMTRHYLKEMSDDSNWPTRRTHHHPPLFDFYVDSKCLGIPVKQVNMFNRILSKHLDYKITDLVAQLMQQHFLIRQGIPHARYLLRNSGQPYDESVLSKPEISTL